jgi:hypothetical protein
VTPLDDAELVDVTGGGPVGATMKFLGRAWPWVDVVTSGWDGYRGYSDARAANKGVGESTGKAAKRFVRSLSMYDLWSPYCGSAY